MVDGWDTFVIRRGYEAQAEHAFADVNPAEYDGLMIPDGWAPEWIRYDEYLQRIVAHFINREKPTAVICHGPQILAEGGHLEGREITCWSTMRTDFQNAHYRDEEVVIDGNLLTCPSWAESGPWMETFVRML